MARYIVTGGAGFIGSNIVDLLIDEGHNVHVLDNFSTGERSYLNPKAELTEFDLVVDSGLERHLKGGDGIFHVAALPRIQPSYTDPIGHDDANVRATLKVAQAMIAAGVKRCVFSGSSAVYGTPVDLPTPETAQIQPLSPYALQKYTAEHYLMTLGERFGLLIGGLRYFNVYGPRSFNPRNQFNAYSSVIGIFGAAVRAGQRPKVTGTGEQRRDFVHVRDVAQANYLAMTRLDASSVLNVGTGKAYTINAIAEMFAPSWDFIPERPGEAAITLADTRRIARLLGWAPKAEVEAAIRAGDI